MNSLEYEKKEIVPVWGGTSVKITYILRTLENYIENKYRVVCVLNGIEDCDLHLSVESVEVLNPTNEETLTAEGVYNLMDDYLE